MVGRDTFSALAPTLGRYQKNCLCDPLPLFMAFSMIPKYVTFELLLRSAFVAGVDWGLRLGLNQLVLHTVRGIKWDLVGPSSPKFRVSAKGFKVRTNVFRVGGRNVILYVAVDVNYHPIRGCRVTKSWSYHVSYGEKPPPHTYMQPTAGVAHKATLPPFELLLRLEGRTT